MRFITSNFGIVHVLMLKGLNFSYTNYKITGWSVGEICHFFWSTPFGRIWCALFRSFVMI